MNLINEKYLIHHGVKGMKWGVRKENPKSNNSRDIKSSIEKRIRTKTTKQLKIAERRGKKIPGAGIVALGVARIYGGNLLIGMATTPLSMLAGPLAPTVVSGANIAASIYTADVMAETIAQLYYRYK